MKVLSINAGSSSLKFSAYEMPEQVLLINGLFERIGLDGKYTIKVNGEKITKEVDLPNHTTAFKILVEELINYGIVKDLEEIKAIGHRCVQGGSINKSVVVDDDVMQSIKDNAPLAPLHNPASAIGIEAAKEVIPNALHVVVFDTAFHTTIPEENYLYPVDKNWYENYRVRRYGFHGTSYRYILERMKQILNKDVVNLIVCHIGNGASICAIKNNESINTTMGFTPVSGLMMSGRCGDIDPSIVTYMIEQGMSVKEVNETLNKKSGLFAISGYSDSRDIENGIKEGNKDCVLAQKMFVRRIVDFIAKYYLELQTVDAIVFTAGIGENSISTRKDILNELKPLRIVLDEEKNNSIAGYNENNEGIITDANSEIPVYVVPTDEELMIAKDAYSFI